MAFEKSVKDHITEYIGAHIADEAWHISYFDFIGEANLAKRLGEEFISTRYIYKLWKAWKPVIGFCVHKSETRCCPMLRSMKRSSITSCLMCFHRKLQ